MPSDGGSGPGGSDGQDGGRGGDSSSSSNSNSNGGGNMGGGFGGIGNWGGGSENDSSEDGSPGAVGGFGGLGYGGFSGMEGSNMNNSITDSMGNVIARRGPLGGFYATVAGMQATDRGFGAHASYSSVSPSTQAAIARAEAADKAAAQEAQNAWGIAEVEHMAMNPAAMLSAYENNPARAYAGLQRAGVISNERAAEAAAQLSADRGIFGAIRDSVFSNNRTMSPAQVQSLAERGQLANAIEGIAKGLVSTTKEGNVQADAVGQMSHAFGALGPAALGFAMGPIGSIVGGTYGALASTLGPAMAVQSLTPGKMSLGTIANAITGNINSAASAVAGPIGGVLGGVMDVGSLNRSLGIGAFSPGATRSTTGTSPYGDSTGIYDNFFSRWY